MGAAASKKKTKAGSGATKKAGGARRRSKPEEKSLDEEVSWDWKRWAAAAVLSGMDEAEIVPTMVADGVAESAAVAYHATLLGPDPMKEAGEWVAQRLRKLESVLTARQAMAALDPDRGLVDRRRGLSREEFLREYYARNVPVVLDDVSTDWPAMERWTPTYLAEVLGDHEIEVMVGRDGDDRYEINGDRHKQTMPFRRFVEQVTSVEQSNDTYLTANNKLLAAEAAAPLWADFDVETRFLEPDDSRQRAFLWFGPAGTVTPYHHDVMNVLFNQILGKKEFLLVSPLDTHRMYNNVGVYTDIDPLEPDFERFPLYREVEPVSVTVGPGESLFIPVGWWHHVRSSEVSISLSFTNFAFPNTVEWDHPSMEL